MNPRAKVPELSPEFAFLLEATKWPHEGETLARIRRAATYVVDPDRLLALTRRHHVTGLVARALAHCQPLEGSGVWRTLQKDALAFAEEQFRQIIQTREAVGALRQDGITAAVLKGAPAALALYGEAGVRSSVDIDLLIDRRDLDRARNVLETIAYQRSDPPANASESQVQVSTRYGKDWGFDHYGSDTGIELHWRLFQNPSLLGQVTVAQAVETVVLPGVVLPVLPASIRALYLVIHGAEHGWSRLKWLADLATLLRRDADAADRILELAQEHGVGPVAMAALMLAAEFYDTPLPTSLIGSVAGKWRTRKLVEIARSCLLGAQDGSELEACPASRTRKNMSHYLFSADLRFWWREAGYDLFHGAAGARWRSVARRARNVLLSGPRAALP